MLVYRNGIGVLCLFLRCSRIKHSPCWIRIQEELRSTTKFFYKTERLWALKVQSLWCPILEHSHCTWQVVTRLLACASHWCDRAGAVHSSRQIMVKRLTWFPSCVGERVFVLKHPSFKERHVGSEISVTLYSTLLEPLFLWSSFGLTIFM